jgi:transcriptional regulator with XRE-family HTH domain
VPAKPTPPPYKPDNTDVRDILAYRVRLLRVSKGWSQERLAMECELDRTYVSAVERKRWNIALTNIEKLSEALGVAPWELLKPVQPD